MVRVPQKILVAPLDWGLGHATRCIPIIRFLHAQGHLVYLGITPQTAPLLCTEFPNLPCIHLPAYDIAYSKTARGLPWKMAQQLPRILRRIRSEHTCLLEAVKLHGIQRVISDNRYGLWHPSLPSVIIIHQVQLQIPPSQWVQKLINKLHLVLLRRFSACWIPDAPDHRLGGALTQATFSKPACAFLGPLSRFNPPSKGATTSSFTLLLLSGPEPQRTQLEQVLLVQAASIEGPVVLVRGTEKAIALPHLPSHWTVHNLLHQHELQPLLSKASTVVCRSGYSTLMDLAVLGKGAVLIPTPGQTEQEYLAQYWSKQKGYVMQTQHELNLADAIRQLQGQAQPEPYVGVPFYETVIENWLASTHKQ